MSPDAFRSIALSMPESVEGSHGGHPDFRVGGKVFASLWDDDEHGMVKLTPEQQLDYIDAHPDTFAPVNGAWGIRGCTRVTLKAAKVSILRRAMRDAWRNTAPKRVLKEHGEI